MKFSKSMVRLNYIFSIGFGILMGMIFPIYAGFFVSFNSRTAEIIFIAGCLIAGLMVGLGAFLITRQTILKVIRDMAGHIRNISGSGSDLRNSIPILSDDELGELPRQFNIFMEEIRKLIDLTQKEMLGISSMSDTLNCNMHETRDSVTDISQVIHRVEKSLMLQLGQVEKNQKAGEKLNDSVRISKTHVLDLFNQMETLTERLNDQSRTIDKILLVISEVSASVGINSIKNSDNLGALSLQLLKDIKQNLEQSGRAYTSLSTFVNEIEDISNRTAILAINASIEASRSEAKSEAFKIIANQVRELAGEAKNLSGEIASSLIDAEKETLKSRENLSQTENSYSKMFQNVEQNLESLQGETIVIQGATAHVESSYSQISELLDSVRTSLEEMQVAMNFSQTVMKDLETSSSHIKDGMSQIMSGSELIESLADKTVVQVETIHNSIKDVDVHINTFNTSAEAKTKRTDRSI